MALITTILNFPRVMLSRIIYVVLPELLTRTMAADLIFIICASGLLAITLLWLFLAGWLLFVLAAASVGIP